MVQLSNYKEYSNGIIGYTIENNDTWHLQLGNRRGWGNGYIGIPEGHPLFGISYWDCELYEGEELTYSQSEVHNGITYWVFGFDTLHSWNTLDNTTEEVVKDTVDKYAEVLIELSTKLLN